MKVRRWSRGEEQGRNQNNRRSTSLTKSTGPIGIKHTSKEVETLKGNSKMHQFEDIGVSPFVRHRMKSCHYCSTVMWFRKI